MEGELMEAVDALTLCESVQEVTNTLDFVEMHAVDSDNVEHVAFLAVALDDANAALAEVRKKVNDHLLACRPMTADPKTGELKPVKELHVTGIPGPIEFPRDVSRKEWRHDDLWADVVRYARDNDGDPVGVLSECARPSWRVGALRAIGIDPSDYCVETWGRETVRLPSRRMDDRGKPMHSEDAA